MKRLRMPTAALLTLIISLSISSISCGGPPSREKLVTIAGYGQQIKGVIEANRTLPDTLLAQKVITPDAYARLCEAIRLAEASTKAFNEGMTTVLASERPDLSVLLPVVADLIAHSRTIGGLINNENAQRVLAGFEIGLRAIATYFATHVKEARAQVERARKLGVSEARIARELEKYDVRAALTVESYADELTAQAGE